MLSELYEWRGYWRLGSKRDDQYLCLPTLDLELALYLRHFLLGFPSRMFGQLSRVLYDKFLKISGIKCLC